MTDMIEGPVAVLIPAGGRGIRLGGPRKQFRRLGDEPVLVHTLRVFDRHPDVAHLVVAVPEEARKALLVELRRVGLTKLTAVVAGGQSRCESVRAALAATPPEAGILLVHDAVRPFVDARDIGAVVQGVRRSGAAALGIAVTDTMRYGEDGRFGESVSRKGLYRMQTPQGFRRDWFERAHRLAEERRLAATDDVEIVMQVGQSVEIIAGSWRNLKITTPEDWEFAQLLWAHRELREGN